MAIPVHGFFSMFRSSGVSDVPDAPSKAMEDIAEEPIFTLKTISLKDLKDKVADLEKEHQFLKEILVGILGRNPYPKISIKSVSKREILEEMYVALQAANNEMLLKLKESRA